MTLAALTIHQPWAWCIAQKAVPLLPGFAEALGRETIPPKRIENRGWKAPAWLIGKYFAVHAGKQYLKEDAEALSNEGLMMPRQDQLIYGAVVAVARLAVCSKWVPPEDHEQAFWWCGPWAWVLDEVAILPTAIECRGYQKLWRLDVATYEAVSEQWGKAA